ncbi:hypothetical protein WDW86_05660 [Bdellovibrionota bacterium FG-2]
MSTIKKMSNAITNKESPGQSREWTSLDSDIKEPLHDTAAALLRAKHIVESAADLKLWTEELRSEDSVLKGSEIEARMAFSRAQSIGQDAANIIARLTFISRSLAHISTDIMFQAIESENHHE